MATITIKDLDALADLALMNADMCEGEPELAVDGYQFRQVSDALRRLLRVDNRDHLDRVLTQCGEPIDVEFSDRCPDCAKLQASKNPPDDPPERGGYREMHEDDPIDRWPFCCDGCGAKRIGDCTCG
jgi:hypothetical protein